MPLSPPAPERAQLLLAQLERYGSRENGQLAVGRRGLTGVLILCCSPAGGGESRRRVPVCADAGEVRPIYNSLEIRACSWSVVVKVTSFRSQSSASWSATCSNSIAPRTGSLMQWRAR